MILLNSISSPQDRARRVRWGSAWATLLLGFALVACSAASANGDLESSGDGDLGNEDANDKSINLGGDGDSPAPPFGDDQAGYGGIGGASGDYCLTFMSWGSVADQGAVPGEDGMDAIVSWLNESSTATGDHYEEKPELSAEFLSHFDVILLQNLSAWEFSEEEVELFSDWVRKGGGVMSLSGYSSDPTEVIPTNRLLEFSDMGYVEDTGEADTSTNLGECSYCLGVTHQQRGWTQHPIAAGIEAVGAYQGRSIEGEGDVVAEEDEQVLGMAKKVAKGRVFLFHDDWVSYNTQWSADAPLECAENSLCATSSPTTSYQIPQFWFNSFRWLSQNRECFAVEHDGIER